MSKTWKTLMIGAAVIAGMTGGASAQPAQDWQTVFDARVPALLSEHDVPAAGIAIVNADGVVYSGVWGEARPGEAATADTLFNVASVAKTIASETMLSLVEAGEFGLDDPMAPYWIDPDIVDDPRAQTLTPRHALGHSTGFHNWRRMSESGQLEIRFDPGSMSDYSGEGYEYLARFAEQVTGQDYAALVHSRLLEPRGIDGVVVGRDPGLAEHYAWSKRPDGSFVAADFTVPASAADDLYITVGGYGAFMAGVIRGEGLSAPLVTQRETIQFDFASRFCSIPVFTDICPDAVGFALYGSVFVWDGEPVIIQGGGDIGERALSFYLPERDLGVIIATNGANGAKLFEPLVREIYANENLLTFLRLQAQQG
ncbi:serine hydrolase domain-containing protein [Maricaulis sp.]|uniref:serine hydrolase domain-containing protein n=1 Tax=Maricaulis sp. TaxID=1486257 RepID=UPI0026388358|nr:serine hydrolase domain-containing protein [Maricaulis sp.]